MYDNDLLILDRCWGLCPPRLLLCPLSRVVGIVGKTVYSWGQSLLLRWWYNFIGWEWGTHIIVSIVYLRDSWKHGVPNLCAYIQQQICFHLIWSKFDMTLCRRNIGIYTFWAQGKIYHYIGDLVPLNGHPFLFTVYFYDTEHILNNWISESRRLNPSIIAKLMVILEKLLDQDQIRCWARSMVF